MPATPRLFISGNIHEICFRTETGLPLICSPFMKVILRGIIAQAFAMYNVGLIAYIVMGNHMHFLVKCINPEHMDDLVAYLKRESAHAINNLLGRRRHTVWEQGYDCPRIADLDHFLERLAYFFTNPASAGLVSTMDEYPNLSSWESVLKDGCSLKGRRIPREVIPALPRRTLSLADQQALAEELLQHALPEQEIALDPFAHVDAFGEFEVDRERLRRRVIEAVREKEAKLSAVRRYPVLGVHALLLQTIFKPFEPKKRGKKMWVLGSMKEIRLPIINWMKEQFAKRKELKRLYGPIEFFNYLPPGFFSPGGYMRANLVPYFTPS